MDADKKLAAVKSTIRLTASGPVFASGRYFRTDPLGDAIHVIRKGNAERGCPGAAPSYSPTVRHRCASNQGETNGTPNYSFSDEQREALAWAIGEAARTAEKWLATEKDLEGAYGPDWVKRLAKEYERIKLLRALANDLRSPSAATDCAVCLEEFARATRKSVASKSARPARQGRAK